MGLSGKTRPRRFFLKNEFAKSLAFVVQATEREVEAIESEHSKNLQSDTFRLFQLGKDRADPRHPFAKFGEAPAFRR